MEWKDSVVLLTGGTGSFGKMFIKIMLQDHCPKKLIVFSRDELKQYEMQTGGFDHPCLRYFIGDIRDKERLVRAMYGVDIVVHAAALKQVPACEYNPFEAVQTNIMGASNIVSVAIDAGVRKVMALSTDKAVNPANLYGATKLVMEKLFIHGNYYSGARPTSFSCVRYGNVVGSRGSVIPLFMKQKEKGEITVTDPRMTRFWLTLEQGVRFVIRSIKKMKGGEIFVPKVPSMKVTDLAEAIAPGCSIRNIGIRPGEKLHEALLSEEEARQAEDQGDSFVLHTIPRPTESTHIELPQYVNNLPDDFSYTSDTNDVWLTQEQLKDLVAEDS